MTNQVAKQLDLDHSPPLNAAVYSAVERGLCYRAERVEESVDRDALYCMEYEAFRDMFCRSALLSQYRE